MTEKGNKFNETNKDSTRNLVLDEKLLLNFPDHANDRGSYSVLLTTNYNIIRFPIMQLENFVYAKSVASLVVTYLVLNWCNPTILSPVNGVRNRSVIEKRVVQQSYFVCVV